MSWFKLRVLGFLRLLSGHGVGIWMGTLVFLGLNGFLSLTRLRGWWAVPTLQDDFFAAIGEFDLVYLPGGVLG